MITYKKLISNNRFDSMGSQMLSQKGDMERLKKVHKIFFRIGVTG